MPSKGKPAPLSEDGTINEGGKVGKPKNAATTKLSLFKINVKQGLSYTLPALILGAMTDSLRKCLTVAIPANPPQMTTV